jgi:hypothetical protein
MPCSPAQLEANRRNAARSTGPNTPEGKQRSRGNALKHGLTGHGVVLPVEDADEVEDRFATLQIEMAPNSLLARQLVRRVALLTVRLQRCEAHEAKHLAHKIRHAAADFDDARRSEAEKLYSWIATEPATHVRRLRNSPEGLALLIAGLEGLLADLDHPDGSIWDYQHGDHLHHLMGLRWSDVPVSRARALSEAMLGNFKHLGPADRPDLARDDRRAWAAGHLIVIVEAELAGLRALRDSMDTRAIEQDREEAGLRALFDPSKEATLARKYEAAAERGLFRTLREYRQVQAETVPPPAPEAAGPESEGEMGSFLPDPEGEEEAEEEMDATDVSGPPGVVEASEIAPEGPSEGGPGGEWIDDR